MFRRLLAASLVACLASCNDSAPSSPTTPSRPVPQSYVVSGTVSEIVNGISRPGAGRRVDLYVSGSPCVFGQPTPCLTELAPVVDTDQNGRYTAQVTVLPRTRVFVTGAGLHALGQQPCLASALVDKDTIIDVQVFPTDSPLITPPAAGPMITGFVYETTAQGRNPLRGVWAWLEVGSSDIFPVAKTQTDDAGRFFFCRVNARVRMDVFADGYQPYSYAEFISGTGDGSFEFEFRR